MITVRNVIDMLQLVADENYMIEGFTFGTLDEVDINKLGADRYPLLYAEIQPVTIDRGALTYSFTLYLMQIIQEDFADRNDSYSETLQMLQDVLDEFLHTVNTESNIYKEGYREVVMSTPITAEPFTARFDNLLTGWNATISLQVNNTNNLCNVPKD